MNEKQRKVPSWLWWLFGCGLVLGIFLIVASIVGGAFLFKAFKKHAAPPIHMSDIHRFAPDLPIYPKAKLDEMMTNFPTNRLITTEDENDPLVSMSILLFFHTTDSFEKVFPWYRQTLLKNGWNEEKLKEVPKWAKQITKVFMEGSVFLRGGETIILQRQYNYSGFLLLFSSPTLPDWKLKRLQHQVKNDPNDADAWTKLAYGYFCMGKWNSAKHASQKALYNPPTNIASKAKLAVALIGLGDYKNALPLTKRLAKEINRWMWFEYQINCLIAMGKPSEAKMVLDYALPRLSKRYLGWAYVVRGMLNWQMNLKENAVKDFERAFKEDEDWWEILVWAYWQTKNQQKAQKLTSKMSQRRYEFAKLFQKRGKESVWLGIYTAYSPDWLTGQWIKETKVEGKWALEVKVVPQSANASLLRDCLVYAVNGKQFTNEREFWSLLHDLYVIGKDGDKVEFSVWRRGRKQKVIAYLEKFFATDHDETENL